MKLEPKMQYVIEAIFNPRRQWEHWDAFNAADDKEAILRFRRVELMYRKYQFRLVRETTSREQIAPKMP